MDFIETKLKGAYVLETKRFQDNRGFLSVGFNKEEFDKMDLNSQISQCNISHNLKKGTLRGMHYQKSPHGEVKIVMCPKGAILDVIIDLRPDSPTFCQWFGVELTEENFKMIYIPKGFAHGFQTLKDDTIVYYHVSEYYHPESACGVKWNDKAFGINWSLPVSEMSERDTAHPYFQK